MNYGNLRTHFKALLNRSDITDALANTFIEQGIQRIQRQLRVPSMERTLTYAITNKVSFVLVPSDMLELISISHGYQHLVSLPSHEFNEISEGKEEGIPKYFMRKRETLELYPAPSSGELKIDYYGEFQVMSADSDESTLAKIASDLICYAALGYAADYYLDERTAVFEQKFIAILNEIQEQANAAEQSGVSQVMRPSAVYDD
jgi:hypothetical protein